MADFESLIKPFLSLLARIYSNITNFSKITRWPVNRFRVDSIHPRLSRSGAIHLASVFFPNDDARPSGTEIRRNDEERKKRKDVVALVNLSYIAAD